MKFKILIKVLLTKFFIVFPQLLSDEAHSKLLFRVMFGDTPDLEHPKTMNEYISATKVSDEKLRYDIYTDKFEVRDYIRKTIGDQYLSEVIGVYDGFNEIDFEQLPNAFEMKATHDSSYNIILSNKSKLDRRAAKKKFNHWLRENVMPFCVLWMDSWKNTNYFSFKGKVGFIQDNKQLVENAMTISLMHNGISC